MAEISNDEARDSGSVLEEEDQSAKVAISEHTDSLPVFVNEQGVTVESGWTADSLEMACPVSGAISELFASAGNESTTEPFVLAGNESTAVSFTNSDGVVPVLQTALDDFEPNSTSCVLSEPASSWSVSDNNVDLVDELNGQSSLTDGREGWEHNVSAVDPNREDREQSIEAMNLQRDTKSGDVSDNFVTLNGRGPNQQPAAKSGMTHNDVQSDMVTNRQEFGSDFVFMVRKLFRNFLPRVTQS